MKNETIHQEMTFKNNSKVDFYQIDSGILLAFNRIYIESIPYTDNEANYLTVNFCISGRCDVTLTSGKYAIVKENRLSISTTVPDGEFYYPTNLYEGIQIYFDAHAANSKDGTDFLSMLGLSPLLFKQNFCQKNNGLYIASCTDEMLPIIKSIWEMQVQPDIPKLRFLLASLFHQIMQLPEKSENETFFTRSQLSIVKETERIILSDLSKKHSARELADLFGVSESSFKLYIKGVLGESYLSYFRRKRMEKAAELLATTHLKVIEIANAVGYDNQGKFARVFADLYGVAPLEYRRLSK